MGAHGASQYNAEFMIAILSLYDNYGLISVNNSAKNICTQMNTDHPLIGNKQ